MQFLVLGYDDSDEGAMDRRMAVRPDHLALGDKMLADGTLWYAAVLTDDDDRMIGSMYMVDFPDREALDEWLKTEPYVMGDVWRKIEVRQCKTRDPWRFNRPQEFFESRQ